MNHELFEIQLSTRHQIMVEILEEHGGDIQSVLAAWLRQYKDEFLDAEIKFYIALNCPSLIQYEETIQDLSDFDKHKIKNKISKILKKNESLIESCGYQIEPKDVDLLNICLYQLYDIRRIALKGALKSIQKNLKTGTLPEAILAPKKRQYSSVS